MDLTIVLYELHVKLPINIIIYSLGNLQNSSHGFEHSVLLRMILSLDEAYFCVHNRDDFSTAHIK